MPRLPDEVPDEILALLLCPELGPASIRKMAELRGSLKGVFHASQAEWRAIERGRPRAAQVMASLAAVNPQEERRRMAATGAGMILHGDPDYPPLLEEIAVPPIGLWVRGHLEALGATPVAVVGARRASAYGVAQAGRFAAHLAEQGVCVVSGGARGVDAEAHRSALRVGGATVAVIGCGLGAGPYPPEHSELYRAVLEAGGALLSEFPTDWPVLKENFPRRNRIIAGLAVATLVVEAGIGSGALITARHASEEGSRPVFAVPGPVDSPRSAGCNTAIRENLAELVQCPEDVMAGLLSHGLLLAAGARASARGAACAAAVETLPTEVARAVETVKRALGKEPRADCARIVEITGLPAHHAQAALTLVSLEAG